LNITLLSNSDLASSIALNHLLPALVREHRVRVFLSEQVGSGHPGSGHPDLAMLKFLEQTLFTRLLFPALGPGRRGAQRAGFAAQAAALSVPFAPLSRINSAQGLAQLAAGEPDLVLSIRYGGILRAPAIAIARLGVLNLHSGLLPDYRGVMATFRAMLDGAATIGTTLHYIRDAGIDTGDIVTRTTRALDYRASYLANVLSLYPAGCAAMLAAVAALARGEQLPTRPQPAGGHYYSFPDGADFQRFYQRGYRLYDVDEITAVARTYLEVKA
jgi:methionyl-tRNA formyltransferase